MIKYRLATFLPLLFPYLLLGVIPSQRARINNNLSNGSLEISENTVMYLPGKGSKKDEDLKDVVQKFNKNFPSEARKEKREATITSIRNFPLPDFPLQIIDIINSYNEEISHLDITKAGNLKILKYLNKYAKKHFTTLTCSLSDESEAALLKRLPNVTRLNVKLMGNENIKNCVRSLLKLNLLTKSIELPESFEDNEILAQLKKQGWKPNPKRNGQKIISLIKGLKNRTVDEKAIIKRTIEQLIKEGADVNAKNKAGRSPLYYALKNGDMELAKFLIGEGADVKTKDLFECNLFHLISEKRLSSLSEKEKIDMAKILIEKGVNINSQEKWGETPLHYAIRAGYTELAKSFIGNGAVMNVQDNQGRTPLYYARQKENLEMIKLLGENDVTDNNISLHHAEVIRSTSLITKQ